MNADAHRIVSVAFAGLIAVSAISGLHAQVSEQSVTYYGLTFPAEIGGARRISVRDYETTSPGLGYSAGYQHRGATSTVYIYDGKVVAIPDDPRAPVVTRQFEQARSDVLTAQAARTTVENKGSFTIADSGNRPRLVCDRFAIKKPDAELIDSFLCMGVVNGKFLKIRTTMPQRSDSETELRRFIGAWAERFWKVSQTGTNSP